MSKRQYKSAIIGKYKITWSEYVDLYERQHGCCAICKVPESSLSQRLCIDHNHKTKKVRGLLCLKCNCGIGYFKESTDFLLSAVTYLYDYEGFGDRNEKR